MISEYLFNLRSSHSFLHVENCRPIRGIEMCELSDEFFSYDSLDGPIELDEYVIRVKGLEIREEHGEKIREEN